LHKHEDHPELMAYLSTTRISQGKAKQVAWVRISVHFERREASGMALNRL
jgi:hypothetical protein